MVWTFTKGQNEGALALPGFGGSDKRTERETDNPSQIANLLKCSI